MKEYIPNIKRASDLGRSCISFVIAGPPGTGKSTFCGTMAKSGKTLLIATLTREAQSWMYQEQNVDVILLEDPDWVPNLKRFNATAFNEFLNILDWLAEDEQYDNVIVDSGTELAELAWHLALSSHNAATPADIEGKSRWLPYDQLDVYLDQAIKGVVSLTKTAKRPKRVGITWHVQPPKDDQTETVGSGDSKVTLKKESTDNKAGGVEYEGTVLPMVRGRFRRRLAGQVDAMLYTDLQMVKKGVSNESPVYETKYMVQVRPNPERHTKLPGALPKVGHIQNDFDQFLKLLSGAEMVEGNGSEPSAEERPAPSPKRAVSLSRK